jgi:hypothetical protein
MGRPARRAGTAGWVTARGAGASLARKVHPTADGPPPASATRRDVTTLDEARRAIGASSEQDDHQGHLEGSVVASR